MEYKYSSFYSYEKEYVLSQAAMTVILPLALGWIMFCVGMSLSLADFRRVLIAPGQVTTGLLLQLVGLPILALAIITLLKLEGPVAIGLWLLALAPGGATSNAISQMCGGDAALSITMTAVSSLLIPLTMPFLLPVVFTDVDLVLPYKTTVLQLVVVTVLPVLLGMLINSKLSSKWKECWLPRLQLTSFVALFITVFVIVLANQHVVAQLWSVAALAAMMLCFSGMFLGFLASKLWPNNASLAPTLSIEVGIQNAGTAIFVAAVLLERPDLALTPLVYGILMNIPVFAMIIWSQRRKAIYA